MSEARLHTAVTSDLIARWRTQSADYLRIAKAYNCRSNREVREGYLKAALTLAQCADELEKALEKPDGEKA